MALTHRTQIDDSTEQEKRSTRTQGTHRNLRVIAFFGGLAALAAVALPSMTAAPVAQAASRFTYRYGLSVQRGWLCRGWANGTLHCTHHWYRDRYGNLISLSQAWVPTGGATSGSTSRSRAGSHSSRAGSFSRASSVSYSGGGRGVGLAPEPCSPNVPSSVWTAVNFTRPGAIPPGCYGGVYNINPAHYVYRPYFGECNWWIEVLRPDEPTMPWSGNYARGMAPRVGATVHYAPGDHGAGPTGHWGHVESVSPDGRWILTSEMNFYWRGGGFGKVVYRYVNIDSGMYFIY